MTNKLSIITVNLNNALGLRGTMASVGFQTYRDFEYIVIDGGSTDGSKEVIEMNKDYISYFVSERDSGIYNAMNKAIRIAKGEYLYFLNSGDVFCGPDVLKEVLSTNCGEDVIIGRINFVDSGGHYHQGFQPRCRNMTPRNFYRTGVPHQASFIKRSLFEEYGLYDESYRISADWKFFLKTLVLNKCSYRYIPVTVANFDGSGISSKNGRLMLDEIERAYAELIPVSERNRVPMKKRIIRSLSEIKNFGLKFYFRIHVMTRIHKSNKYRQGIILEYLKSRYSKCIKEDGDITVIEDHYPVWVCWLQGRSSMPSIVSKCFTTLLSFYGIDRVRLLSTQYVADYIKLPTNIVSLHSKGRISNTHFCDVIRMQILEEYGGLWIDSTVLMTGMPNLSGKVFFSIKGTPVDDTYVSNYMWAGYCLGARRNNPLFRNLVRLYVAYWKDHDRIIDYYLMDFFIRMCYDLLPSIRKMIDDNEPNNLNVSSLQNKLCEAFSQAEFDALCKNTVLHKLSWKGSYQSMTSDGRETNYGHIINHQ